MTALIQIDETDIPLIREGYISIIDKSLFNKLHEAVILTNETTTINLIENNSIACKFRRRDAFANFGNMCLVKRNLLNMSREDLAKKIHISSNVIENMERQTYFFNKSDIPAIDRLGKFLDIPIYKKAIYILQQQYKNARTLMYKPND